MRQHPRPTYGKARGQWPPPLDKGDPSVQFHCADGKHTAPQLDSRVFRTASLCMAVCQPGKGNIFHAGHEKRDRVHSVPQNETLPGAKPDSERNRYDPCATERRRRPRRPPKRAGREKGGAKNTDLPFRRPAWYIYMVVQGSRTRRARPLQLCPTQCNSPGSRRGGQPSHLVCSLPSHGLTHNGGLSSRRLTPLRCILALTVPVVRGLATPFLLCRRLARGGLYGRRRHWINRLFIYLSATLYYRNWPLSTLLPTPMPRPGSSLR